MIELDNVTRTYGRKTAVRDLSLSIPAGELFAFLGPNGAGKTTTIKMLTGLLQPSQGQLRVDGFDVVQSPREAAHSIGFVPDEPHLYDKLSGREFLQFVADLFAMPTAAAAEEIERQIKLFDLSTFIDHLAESYSHGMKQRLVMAAALMHAPRILVVDEPTVGMDPRGARLLKQIFLGLAAAGATVFMSTHSLEVAEELCDRIGIILRGRLIAIGTVDELHEQAGRHDGATLESVFLRLTGAAADLDVEAAAPA